jgi:hypothetical protein
MFFVDQKLQYVGLPNYRRSLLREHTVLQNMKFLQFYPILWIIFACLDPPNLRGRDPDRDRVIAMQIQIQIQIRIQFRSDPDPDPGLDPEAKLNPHP